MYVFRSERRLAPAEDLLGGLRNALSCSSSAAAMDRVRDGVLDALLRAGELECALADAETDNYQLALICSITDTLAGCLLRASNPPPHLMETVARLQLPQTLCVPKPEGFAYYGLHPLDYALLANSCCGSINRAAVIGLRSIGATLSAVVFMKLAGGTTRLAAEMDREEFLRQIREYEEVDRTTLDRAYKLLLTLQRTHPFAMQRAKELDVWWNGGYQQIMGRYAPVDS